jgi:hypothetical protein
LSLFAFDLHQGAQSGICRISASTKPLEAF